MRRGKDAPNTSAKKSKKASNHVQIGEVNRKIMAEKTAKIKAKPQNKEQTKKAAPKTPVKPALERAVEVPVKGTSKTSMRASGTTALPKSHSWTPIAELVSGKFHEVASGRKSFVQKS